MTYEEAINRLKWECSGCMHPQQVGYCENKCEYGVAIASMFKQTPKKPIVVQDSWYVDVDDERTFDIFQCPTCNKQVNETNEQPYCWNCGQRIDWSEVE